MKIQLVDINPAVTKAWEHAFKDVPEVSVHCCDLFELPTDCVVSAANSFGFMDGGVDAVISKRLPKIQEYVQRGIKETKPTGELLVGEAMMLVTGDEDIRYCLSAPTMRRPVIISGTVNVYLAAKAIFAALQAGSMMGGIGTATIPGLGTSTGRVHPDVSATQMRLAYNDIMNRKEFPKSWQQVRMEEDQMHKKYVH